MVHVKASTTLVEYLEGGVAHPLWHQERRPRGIFMLRSRRGMGFRRRKGSHRHSGSQDAPSVQVPGIKRAEGIAFPTEFLVRESVSPSLPFPPMSPWSRKNPAVESLEASFHCPGKP